jgi:hypothetical protein
MGPCPKVICSEVEMLSSHHRETQQTQKFYIVTYLKTLAESVTTVQPHRTIMLPPKSVLNALGSAAGAAEPNRPTLPRFNT